MNFSGWPALCKRWRLLSVRRCHFSMSLPSPPSPTIPDIGDTMLIISRVETKGNHERKWQWWTESTKSSTLSSFPKISNSDAMDQLQLQRYCCRRMVMTHVDLIEKFLRYVTLPFRYSFLSFLSESCLFRPVIFLSSPFLAYQHMRANPDDELWKVQSRRATAGAWAGTERKDEGMMWAERMKR